MNKICNSILNCHLGNKNVKLMVFDVYSSLCSLCSYIFTDFPKKLWGKQKRAKNRTFCVSSALLLDCFCHCWVSEMIESNSNENIFKHPKNRIYKFQFVKISNCEVETCLNFTIAYFYELNFVNLVFGMFQVIFIAISIISDSQL